MHKRGWKSIAKRAALPIFFLFALGYAAYILLDQSHRVEPSVHFSLIYFFGALALQMVYWSIASILWKRLLYLFTSTPITLAQSFIQLNLVSIGKYLPGKVWGMLARGYYLQRCGLSTGEIVSATFHEQLLWIHSGFVLSGVLAAFLIDTPSTNLVGLVSVASIFLGAWLQRLGIRIFLRLKKMGTDEYQKLKVATELPMNTYIALLMNHTGAWVVNGLVLSAIYFAFIDPNFNLSLLPTLILSNTVGIVAGFLAIFAPGGIGVREAVTSGVLSTIMPLKTAILLSLLYRLWLVSADLIIGGSVAYITRKQHHPSHPNERL